MHLTTLIYALISDSLYIFSELRIIPKFKCDLKKKKSKCKLKGNTSRSFNITKIPIVS